MTSQITYKIFQFERVAGRTRYLIEDSSGDFHYGQSFKSIAGLEIMSSDSIKSELRYVSLSSIGVDTSDYFATYNPSTMTKFTGNINDPAVFVKRQRLLIDSQDYRMRPERFGQLTAREVEVCETLKANPHGNVCQYLGVVLASGHAPKNRITGIVYKRYDCDLDSFVEKGLLKNVTQGQTILMGLKAGVNHLHKLGFVHCDVRPANVFLRTSTPNAPGSIFGAPPICVIVEVAIGDFDAVTKEAHEMELKHAPDEWWNADFEIDLGDAAMVEIDEYGLAQIDTWLMSKVDASSNGSETQTE